MPHRKKTVSVEFTLAALYGKWLAGGDAQNSSAKGKSAQSNQDVNDDDAPPKHKTYSAVFNKFFAYSDYALLLLSSYLSVLYKCPCFLCWWALGMVGTIITKNPVKPENHWVLQLLFPWFKYAVVPLCNFLFPIVYLWVFTVSPSKEGNEVKALEGIKFVQWQPLSQAIQYQLWPILYMCYAVPLIVFALYLASILYRPPNRDKGHSKWGASEQSNYTTSKLMAFGVVFVIAIAAPIPLSIHNSAFDAPHSNYELEPEQVTNVPMINEILANAQGERIIANHGVPLRDAAFLAKSGVKTLQDKTLTNKEKAKVLKRLEEYAKCVHAISRIMKTSPSHHVKEFTGFFNMFLVHFATSTLGAFFTSNGVEQAWKQFENQVINNTVTDRKDKNSFINHEGLDSSQCRMEEDGTWMGDSDKGFAKKGPTEKIAEFLGSQEKGVFKVSGCSAIVLYFFFRVSCNSGKMNSCTTPVPKTNFHTIGLGIYFMTFQVLAPFLYMVVAHQIVLIMWMEATYKKCCLAVTLTLLCPALFRMAWQAVFGVQKALQRKDDESKKKENNNK